MFYKLLYNFEHCCYQVCIHQVQQYFHDAYNYIRICKIYTKWPKTRPSRPAAGPEAGPCSGPGAKPPGTGARQENVRQVTPKNYCKMPSPDMLFSCCSPVYKHVSTFNTVQHDYLNIIYNFTNGPYSAGITCLYRCYLTAY